MSKVYVKPKFAQAIDKAINQNKSISDKPGKLDSSLKVLKKIGKAHNHSLTLGFQWLWLQHNVDLLTPYQVKYFNRKKGTSAWKRKGSGEMADIKENTMKERISVSDERYFGKRGIIIMIDDNGKTVSAIFKDKKNANKFNRNKPSDIKKLLKLAKGKKYPQAIDEARGSCWVGYKQVGMKDKGGRKVPNCVKETTEIFYEENGQSHGYTLEYLRLPEDINEAEYQGRKVKLGKPMQGDVKKFKVYVKNPAGNVVKVNFGHGGTSAKGKTMKIRKSNPDARRSFRARHNCDTPGPRHKARYWSCRKW